MAGAKLTHGEIVTHQDDALSQPAAATAEQQVQLRIEKVYLKDASFESPRAPEAPELPAGRAAEELPALEATGDAM